MAYNRIQAGRLLSNTELPVFLASLAEQIGGLTAGQLRAFIKRTRVLREKSQDLWRRQRVATRGRTGSKAGNSGVANARSEQKVQAFDEALQRFEKRLAQLEAAAARAASATTAARTRLVLEKKRSNAAVQAAARAPRRSAKAPAAPPQPGGASLGPTSEAARAARHAQHRKTAGGQAIQAHVGARGRRNQAKRDSR